VGVPARGIAQQDQHANGGEQAGSGGRRRHGAQGGEPKGDTCEHDGAGRQHGHARPAGRDVGELLQAEKPAGEHEQAHGERDKRGKSREKSV
jgi:hypothetical protein